MRVQLGIGLGVLLHRPECPYLDAIHQFADNLLGKGRVRLAQVNNTIPAAARKWAS